MENFNKYLSFGQLEEDWGFYITTAGYTKTATNQIYPLNSQHPDSHKFNWDSGRILDGYYLVFITQGEGVFESAQSASYHIKEGTCFLLFPNVWHRYKPLKGSGWEEYWVGFKGAYPDLLMKNFDQSHPFIHTGRSDQLLRMFHLLLQQIEQGATGYHQVITGITLQILGLVKSLSYEQINYTDFAAKYVEDAKFLLREAVSSKENIEIIVKKLPISYSKLRKDFKRLTGTSPNQYLLDLKLQKAKELMANTSLSITEITYQTGFESVPYLSRIFKSKNGVTPKDWRNSSFED